jgi:hypothetical protein
LFFSLVVSRFGFRKQQNEVGERGRDTYLICSVPKRQQPLKPRGEWPSLNHSRPIKTKDGDSMRIVCIVRGMTGHPHRSPKRKLPLCGGRPE